MEAGYDPSLYNDIVLRVACHYGSSECIKLLLSDLNVDPNNHDHDENTLPYLQSAPLVIAMKTVLI
jgi:hypothetical protein